MLFNVEFITDDDKKPLVLAMGAPGLDMLDDIRENHEDLKGIEASAIDVYSGCPINGSVYNLDLTEQQARATGLFKGKTSVTVKVNEHAFTRFVGTKVKMNYSTRKVKPGFSLFGYELTPGKIEEYLYGAEVHSTFDTKALLANWAQDGFPTEWSLGE